LVPDDGVDDGAGSEADDGFESIEVVEAIEVVSPVEVLMPVVSVIFTVVNSKSGTVLPNEEGE